ncbi:unnamed protein product [Pseudo-nitzschia multistriata]|uniref:Uncharacterized protein n=1 Tax=Pseudo-nitzschia multistriata TaxID=183589 RepID=A0A448YVW4_9STRA|nr:unnamed protein product [Pseudo-nitzschia multistriata]
MANIHPAFANPCGRYKIAGPTIPLMIPSTADVRSPPLGGGCASASPAVSSCHRGGRPINSFPSSSSSGW